MAASINKFAGNIEIPTNAYWVFNNWFYRSANVFWLILTQIAIPLVSELSYSPAFIKIWLFQKHAVKWAWCTFIFNGIIDLNISSCQYFKILYCLNLSCLNPERREKIKLNFYFHTSSWCLERFYEGLKGLHKTFWGNRKKYENKNLT